MYVFDPTDISESNLAKLRQGLAGQVGLVSSERTWILSEKFIALDGLRGLITAEMQSSIRQRVPFGFRLAGHNAKLAEYFLTSSVSFFCWISINELENLIGSIPRLIRRIAAEKLLLITATDVRRQQLLLLLHERFGPIQTVKDVGTKAEFVSLPNLQHGRKCRRKVENWSIAPFFELWPGINCFSFSRYVSHFAIAQTEKEMGTFPAEDPRSNLFCKDARDIKLPPSSTGAYPQGKVVQLESFGEKLKRFVLSTPLNTNRTLIIDFPKSIPEGEPGWDNCFSKLVIDTVAEDSILVRSGAGLLKFKKRLGANHRKNVRATVSELAENLEFCGRDGMEAVENIVLIDDVLVTGNSFVAAERVFSKSFQKGICVIGIYHTSHETLFKAGDLEEYV